MLPIGKFAKAGGVGVETIRFYQRKGLLRIPKQEGGIRRYDDRDIRQLKFILKAKAAGFTLAEIKELIVLDSSNDRHKAYELATSRVSELDKKIAELQQARNALQKLATECRGSKTGPCPIIEAFDD
ncbi:MerR family transcriptional regulator [Kangiella koreensis]|uniref:Mercuric resistance operon regulatory protein n=1 Tax=Kangiella koreensis (strain DSM 16069 / JCM 12317 / KCTC 12182 / SW-125) TaxID=523791 RepID=C7RBX9_KANKD|nr:MerR family transcriptional regulator [Kangiella koreensis]ACV26771.1 transcriptional regulator, MerR family [Kangiella koreensis DSM 16069]